MHKSKRVHIINRSAHNYEAAAEYGSFNFLSEGPLDKLAVNNMDRIFADGLRDSGPDDYILPTSLTVASIVACLRFAQMHGRLNLLLYKGGRYEERTLDYRRS